MGEYDSIPALEIEATLACRCEEVSLEEIARALAAGAVSLNDVKRRTRAGMGLCQGICCMPAIAAMVAQATGTSIDRVAPMTVRPPVRPMRLDALAGLDRSFLDIDGSEREDAGD